MANVELPGAPGILKENRAHLPANSIPQAIPANGGLLELARNADWLRTNREAITSVSVVSNNAV